MSQQDMVAVQTSPQDSNIRSYNLGTPWRQTHPDICRAHSSSKRSALQMVVVAAAERQVACQVAVAEATEVATEGSRVEFVAVVRVVVVEEG